MSATFNGKWEKGNETIVTVRSQDQNGRALLAQAVKNINWASLYRMQTCEEMVTCFYDTVTGLVDAYLPLLV